MVIEAVPHPTPFSDRVLDAIRPHVDPGWLVLDPYAGIGKVHQLPCKTIGVELELEWAEQHPRTMVGNALNLIEMFGPEWFDAIITSPTFGNRYADHHNAKDGSKRHTYKHYLGRDLSEDNSGAMQWGSAYRMHHLLFLDQAFVVLKRKSKLFLNISDHIRGDKRIYVSRWWRMAIDLTGFKIEQVIKVPTQRMRHGANNHLRVVNENVIIASKL